MTYTKRKIAYVLTAGLVLFIFFYFVGGDKNNDYESVVARRGIVIQEVNVTGRVKPAKSVDLAFEREGRVVGVFAEAGDRVFANQVLVKLSSGDLVARLRETEANIKTQKAILLELKAGKNLDLDNSYNQVLNVLADAYAKADDAVRTKTVSIFMGSINSYYQLLYTPCIAEPTSKSKTLRLRAEFELRDWQKELNVLRAEASRDDLDRALEIAAKRLLLFSDLLKNVSDTLNAACIANDTSFNSQRSDISAARSSISMAINNVDGIKRKIIAQKSALNNTVPEQIIAQEARVGQAEAQLQNIRALMAKTAIRSPINGVVTKQLAKIGEVVSAGVPIVSIISEFDFEIEANIPEADIAKIKVGEIAQLTLDAYGDDVEFEAAVVKINPAETIVDGVATYETIFRFTQKDDRVKSGMTANIDMVTAKRDGVIVVPQRSVVSKNGKKFIRIIKNGELAEVEVAVGLRGSDGRIEIIKGVKEGDEIYVFGGSK